MKLALTSAALAVALSGLLASPAALAANDSKVYAGSGCKVFGSTAWTDLHFSAAGITNLTSSPKNVICPIIKDSEGAYDGDAGVPVNAPSMHLHIASGNVGSTSVCNVYTIDNGSGGTYVGVTETSTYNTGPMPASTEYNDGIFSWTGESDGLHTSVMMLCTLGPKAALRFYRVTEQGNTEL